MSLDAWLLVLNTLLLAAAVAAGSVPAGAVLGWLLARTDLPGRRGVLGLVAAMLFMPLYLQAAAWQAGCGPQGWLTMAFGSPAWLDGWWGPVWVHTLAAVPWVALLAAAGFAAVPAQLEEQALVDASPRRVFLGVTLPLSWPMVGAAAVWVMVLTAAEMTVTDLYSVRAYTATGELYTRLASGDTPAEALAGMTPALLLSAGLVLAGFAIVSRLLVEGRPSPLRRAVVFALGAWRWPAWLFVGLVLVLIVGVPVASLCYKAGLRVDETPTGWVRSWSPAKLLAMTAWSPIEFHREIRWSLTIGSLAATTAVAAGVLLAWWARRRRWAAMVLAATAAVGLALPGPLIGLAVVWAMNRPGVPWLTFLYDQSIFAPWLTLALRSLPAAAIILWYALRSVPEPVLEAAALDGAGSAGRLVRIALPLQWPAVAIAWVVALAVALGDLAASILVVPPGVETLSIHVFGLLHAGVEDRVAAVCLAQIAHFGLLAGVVLWLVGWLGRSGARRESTSEDGGKV